MSADNFKVNLSLKDTVTLLDRGIVDGSISGERVDYHVVTGDDIHGVIVLVYEKFFHRVGNRLCLTITVDNMNGSTNIHCIGAGGGNGIFINFDWGAGDSFSSAPREILKPHIIN